ncbi:SDR family NAD(P)-dependent oxidoreductase [Agromyces binzhouensis]|uniref:SDR family NAD(P)-dependent oxidoreductase n=1 Tax=Agromyces binzhouensis TaxID=1817495 RepID=UPI001A921E8D|nr:SDR family oxidoreductase [Agromyces binzhouensis]
MTRIEQARILVVGASGALGTLIAERLAERGARLVLHGRDPARLGASAGAATVAVDLTEADAPETIVDRAVEALGGLDAIVVAAGVVGFDGVAETAGRDLETMFTVNALAPMRIISVALPSLRDSAAEGNEPVVLTISGIVSELPTAGLASYSASKAALAAYVAAAGRELRRSGIRLVDARPGHTETGLADRPLFGTAPRFPHGHDPANVADRLVRAIEDGSTSLPPDAFTGA